jgi:hypothetical protein
MTDQNANVVNVPQHSIGRSIVPLGLAEIVLGSVEIGVGRERVDNAITQLGVQAIGYGLFEIMSAYYHPSETCQTNITREQELRIATLLFRLYEQGIYGAALDRVQNVGHRAWINWIQPGAQRVEGLFRREENALQE